MKVRTLGAVTALLIACLTNNGCNRKSTKPTDAEASLGRAVDSLVSVLGAPLSDLERTTNLSHNSPPRNWLSLISSAYAASCTDSRYLPALLSGPCPGNLVVLSYASCTAGPDNEAVLTGNVTLTFDVPVTCDGFIAKAGPTNGSMLWTTQNFARSNADGTSVATSSLTHKNYQDAAMGGGISVVFGNPTHSLSYLGLHRVGTGGKLGDFDHSIRSSAAVVVSGTKAAGDRQIAAGTLVLDDNTLQLTASAAITNLKWGVATCCYPSAGSMALKLTGSATGTASLDFNTGTCGTVTLKSIDGKSSTLVLQGCE